jgi:hypothetical protein
VTGGVEKQEKKLDEENGYGEEEKNTTKRKRKGEEK